MKRKKKNKHITIIRSKSNNTSRIDSNTHQCIKIINEQKVEEEHYYNYEGVVDEMAAMEDEDNNGLAI
eukprot:13817059-Ditylum_brightwellii.AAC.1